MIHDLNEQKKIPQPIANSRKMINDHVFKMVYITRTLSMLQHNKHWWRECYLPDQSRNEQRTKKDEKKEKKKCFLLYTNNAI